MKKQQIKIIEASKLVEDMSLYPRSQVDNYHIAEIAEAREAGISLPPLIAESTSYRIIDGLHRRRAEIRLYGENAKLKVILKSYKNDAEMFLEAMRLNASHGRNLTSHDRARCVIMANEFHIPEEDIATSLNIRIQKVDELLKSHTATEAKNGTKPIKKTIKHLAGTVLSKRQMEVVPKLGGMDQAFYVRQLLLLIDNDLLDTENEGLIALLKELTGKLKALKL